MSPTSPTHLVDIGANLCHASFAADLPAVLARAAAVGVSQILVTGSDAASNRQALALARQHPRRLFATCGLHPHHAEAFDEDYAAAMTESLAQPEVRAGGECGLDYYRDLAPRTVQRRAFVRQLELTVAAGKPAFLHQREAHADFLAILKEFRRELPAAVVHCFTDGAEALEAYLALDCHIGITGWVADERRGTGLRALVPRIPEARLMIETDAPYLLPRSLRPKPKTHRNEPCWLPEVLRQVALCRGQPGEQVAAQTARNARAFFDLPDPDP